MTAPVPPTVLARLDAAFRPAGDPARAVGAARYMRNQFPFLGLTADQVTTLGRAALAGLAPPTSSELAAVALACWERPEREYQYFACGYLRRYVRVGSPSLLPTVRTLITTKSWWDTVDTLAAHTVGPLVLTHSVLVSAMDEWVADPHLWLVRAALLHQLTYKQRTDADRLFRYCTRQSAHPDFFIRKAIGWALRAYSRVDAPAVRSYVDGHRSRLSRLSVREASRQL